MIPTPYYNKFLDKTMYEFNCGVCKKRNLSETLGFYTCVCGFKNFLEADIYNSFSVSNPSNLIATVRKFTLAIRNLSSQLDQLESLAIVSSKKPFSKSKILSKTDLKSNVGWFERYYDTSPYYRRLSPNHKKPPVK